VDARETVHNDDDDDESSESVPTKPEKSTKYRRILLLGYLSGKERQG
jgi:hypothetical protein